MSDNLAWLKHVGKYSDVIRTGAVAFDYRTGQCGPVQATQTKSWGAACPPGYCPPGNLPAALGRWFAGDRAGCRELPFTVQFTGTQQAAVATTVTVSANSLVDMCPTRMLSASDGGEWTIVEIKFGNQNQIVGGPVPIEVWDIDSFQLVPMVPDCLRAGQPYTMTLELAPNVAAATVNAWLTFIGPMVG